MFPPIPPIINVDMIYQYQSSPYMSFVPGFNPNPIIQQNPFISQLIHTQLINNQILQNVSIAASMFAQHQQQQQQQQLQSLQIPSSSLPTSSTTEINDIESNLQETNVGSKIKFATWNVRGAVDNDKRNAIDKCLNEKMVQIACLQETKLQLVTLDTANYKWYFVNTKADDNFHYGTAILVRHSLVAAVSNFEAVTGNILSCFVRSNELTILVIAAHLTDSVGNEIEFERLKNFLKLYQSLPTIIFGDFNAQLGKSDLNDADHVFMGRYLYHDKCNNNGRLLKDLASEAKLFIKNTFGSHKVYKWKFILTTCRLKEKTSSSKAEETQIDHILISRDGVIFVKMLRGYYQNHIYTDHKLIVADVEIRHFEHEKNEESTVNDLSQDDLGECSRRPAVEESGDESQNPINVEASPLQSTVIQQRPDQQKQKRLRTKETVSQKRKLLTEKRTDIANHIWKSNVVIGRYDLEVSRTVNNSSMQISPGEPVPPGFEDVVKPVAELQVTLSKYRSSPLIGLEYIIELIMGEQRPRTYHCALCDTICETKEVIDHIISYDHRCKYLEKHFPTVISLLTEFRCHANAKNVLSTVIENVCEAVEVAYGRMVPNVFENNDYTANRALYMNELSKERHFDENCGSTFVGLIDLKAIQMRTQNLDKTSEAAKKLRRQVQTTVRNKRTSFDSISSSDSISPHGKNNIIKSLLGIEPFAGIYPIDLITPDDEDASRKRRKRTYSHKSSSSSYSKNDETEEFKYERYRNQAQKAIDDLNTLLQEYEKYPEKHPLYPSEWNRYWLRRSEQLKAVGVDPRTFDFSSEWSKYWLRRMKELYEEDVALKKFEIRKKLNLSSDYYPRSALSNFNEPGSSLTYHKEDARNDQCRMKLRYDRVEDHIDDEPLTVISVLRLLAAFENLLGASLGPKVVDLLSKAVALEKVKANLADDLLMSAENSVLLDTIKEKLKGLIIAKVLTNQQITAVGRAIRNVTSIVKVIDNKISASKEREQVQSYQTNQSTNISGNIWTENQKTLPEPKQSFNNNKKYDSRSEISKQIATAFLIQKINISNERLERLTDIYISKSAETSETPYLFGVYVSQKLEDKNETEQISIQNSSCNQSQISNYGESSFAFNLFQNNDRNLGNVGKSDNTVFSPGNSSNSTNFASRNNNLNDSYSKHNTAQNNLHNHQTHQIFRSQDNSHFSQQNTTHHGATFNTNITNMNTQSNQQQRNNFQNQNIPNSQNSQSINNYPNHFNQSNQRRRDQVQIWDSQPIMASSSNSQFNTNSNISIWDTNPMQNQPYNQSSFQQNVNQQSQYSNYSKYQEKKNVPDKNPWMQQQQNVRKNRYH